MRGTLNRFRAGGAAAKPSAGKEGSNAIIAAVEPKGKLATRYADATRLSGLLTGIPDYRQLVPYLDLNKIPGFKLRDGFCPDCLRFPLTF